MASVEAMQELMRSSAVPTAWRSRFLFLCLSPQWLQQLSQGPAPEDDSCSSSASEDGKVAPPPPLHGRPRATVRMGHPRFAEVARARLGAGGIPHAGQGGLLSNDGGSSRQQDGSTATLTSDPMAAKGGPQGLPSEWTTLSSGVSRDLGFSGSIGSLQWFVKSIQDLFAKSFGGAGLSSVSVWEGAQAGSVDLGAGEELSPPSGSADVCLADAGERFMYVLRVPWAHI